MVSTRRINYEQEEIHYYNLNLCDSYLFLGYFIRSDVIISNEILNSTTLPDEGFTSIQYYNSSLCDSYGNRAFPWGIEIWNGTPSSAFIPGQVQLTGYSLNNVEALALPNPINKPIVQAGLSYTQSFEVKLVNVQGEGVRLLNQWFGIVM